METYLVGGAVRDQLLGLPIVEKDYVVVGSNVAEMLAKGFRQVGKDFPVFLHPETQEEYALARTERKVSKGYTGFEFNADPKVTLEEDLSRRDLTINAIAQTLDGKLVDPFRGKQDLEDKILRHVSPAFVEDPVRILRVARFAARFQQYGFKVAPETNALMTTMVSSGEVDALVPERIWKEFEKALQEQNPEAFFSVLQACNAQAILFPEIDEKDIKLLKTIAQKTQDAYLRFAFLCSNLSAQQIESFSSRLRIPNDYKDLAILVSKYLPAALEAKTPEAILELFTAVDAYRRDQRFEKFLAAIPLISSENSQEILLKGAWLASKKVDLSGMPSLKGTDIAVFIHQQRLDLIKNSISP